MRKYLVVFVAVLLVAGTAYATADSPTPPLGWGKDCTNWIHMIDVYGSSGEMCYDPNGSGGAGWVRCDNQGPAVWPGLDIELWIEMECQFTWGATHAQIHRASNYDPIVMDFCGTSACNNGQYIITTPPTATPSLATLPFVQNIFGGTSGGPGIPLTWEYSLDGSPWAPMLNFDTPAEGKYFLIDVCNHGFCIRATGTMAYHQADGYYHLGGPGASICPATPL